MTTINFSNKSDIIIPSNNGFTYRGLTGSDVYILSPAIEANAKITIVDTGGLNKIQLVDGLSIASSKFANDAVQLTLSNGAVVTINGASNFTYELGGNATTGVTAESNTFSEFAFIMGIQTLPTSGAASGASNIVVDKNGLTPSNSPTFTVTKDTNGVTEGGEVTFTITASSAVSADTSFSWSAMGDTNGSTVTAAENADIETLSGTALISSGSSSVTFKVKITNDSEGEPLEGVKVNVFDKDGSSIGSLIFLIDNDAGDSSSTSDLKGTDGDDDLTLTSGNDNYEPTLGADTVNAGDGEDTIVVLRGTKIIKSQDVFGLYTGTKGKTYLDIQLDGQTKWTTAYNFEKIQIKGEDNFTLIDDYFSKSRWDVFSIEIDDIIIEDNTTKNINLSDSFWTYNADTTMEYSIDFSNDKVSDQITLSGSNLSLKGGSGGDSYTVIITVRGTQKFSDNFNFSTSDYNYDDQIFTITLSDDDYTEGQTGTSSDDNITLTNGDDTYEYTSGNDKIDGGAGSDTFIASSEDVIIVRAIDVRGEDAYTGIEGKEFLYIISKNESGYTVATNFENIEYDGVKSSLDNFPSYSYVDVSSWRNDTEGIKIQDQNIENNDSKTINLDNNFFTINKDASLTYSIDFSNDKVSDQISISGSNLSIQGGVGGDKYEVKVTVRATQSFSDGRSLSDDFMYEEDTFIITLSDDDYIPVNASNSLVPSSSSLTKISVTEDISGGILLDLTPLNIDKGSIKIKSWGVDSDFNTDFFDDYIYIDEEVLKLKDGVIFNTDRGELRILESFRWFPNATSGEFNIVFDYESNGVNERHTVKITEFIDTIYGQGLYGDGNYIDIGDDDFSQSSNNNIKSVQSISKWINTSSNSSEIIEIFYSFVSSDSKFISDSLDPGLYQSTDANDIILDPVKEFKDAVYDILSNTASIFKLNFTELTGDDVDRASLRFVLWDSSTANASGYSRVPQDKASFVFILKSNTNDYSKGSYQYDTIRHEIGHALGLKHPFDDDKIDSEFNSVLYSIMTYQSIYDTIATNPYDQNDSGSYLIDRSSGDSIGARDWGMYDIAALKSFYGIRSNYNLEDNTYTFTSNASLQTIHDLGGYDTIDLSGSSADNDIKAFQIDLGGGAFYQAGNVVMTWSGDSFQTGAVYTTSFDTEIEKFIGSNGADNVILGPTSDTIISNGGDDTIYSVGFYKSIQSIKVNAGSGDDFVSVFFNTDEVNSLIDINGGSGNDWLSMGTDETNIDLSLYMKHFDNFEYYSFYNSNPQTITIDAEDFIIIPSSYLAIKGGTEDTVILPEGAVEDTTLINPDYDYYVLNDVTIAIHDDLMIG